MINLRQKSQYSDVLTYGDFIAVADENESLIVYKRSYEGQTIVNVCNFSNQEQSYVTDNQIILNNYHDYDGKTLQPYQTIMYTVNEN